MWTVDNAFEIKVLFTGVLILLVTERLWNTFVSQKANEPAKKVFHKGFFYLLLGSYLSIVIVGCLSVFVNPTIYPAVSLAGAFLLCLGIWLRRKAIQSLNQYWSVFIEIKEGQQLIRDGIYRYLKHPYYTGVVLELFGFSLLCNAWWGIGLTFAIQVPLLLIRIHYENRILKIYGKRFRFTP